MSACVQCQKALLQGVCFCPFCGHAVAGTAVAKARPAPVPLEAKAAPVALSKARPKLEAKVESKVEAKLEAKAGAKLEPGIAAAAKPVPPPPGRVPARKWPRWLAGAAVVVAGIAYINGKMNSRQDSLCNNAIDSGLTLLNNGSVIGARVKLAEAIEACSGKSSAKVEDLQALIRKAAVASGACKSSTRSIERDVAGHRMQSASKAIAGLDADCASALTVEQLRKQVMRQQAAAASIQVGVRQSLDDRNSAAAKNGIAKLEAIDREHPQLAQLKTDLQALTAVPAPVAVPEAAAPSLLETAPSHPVQSDAAPARTEMAQSFLRDAERALNEGRFDAAKTYLDSVRRIDPDNVRIDSLSHRIRDRERQVLQTETSIR